MRVAWVHNFSANQALGAGVFMWQLGKAIEDCGVEIKEVFVGNLRTTQGLARALFKIRSETADCDLTHVQYGSLCGFLGSRIPKHKILTLRGSDWHVVPKHVDRFVRYHSLTSNWLTKLALPKYDRVITVSDRMGKEVKEYRRDLATETIPDGINFSRFRPMDKMESRAQLGMNDDKRLRVLFSSVLDNNALKRKPLADAAIAVARQRLPDLAVSYMNNVPHEDVPLHVNAADVVLLTSTHEGWPNIVKEGLACNIPFVSTDVSDLAKVARSTSSCFVAAATPEALGDALVKSLTGKKDAGLKNTIADMDMSNTARKLIRVYEDVCGRRI